MKSLLTDERRAVTNERIVFSSQYLILLAFKWGIAR